MTKWLELSLNNVFTLSKLFNIGLYSNMLFSKDVSVLLVIIFLLLLLKIDFLDSALIFLELL